MYYPRRFVYILLYNQFYIFYTTFIHPAKFGSYVLINPLQPPSHAAQSMLEYQMAIKFSPATRCFDTIGYQQLL